MVTPRRMPRVLVYSFASVPLLTPLLATGLLAVAGGGLPVQEPAPMPAARQDAVEELAVAALREYFAPYRMAFRLELTQAYAPAEPVERDYWRQPAEPVRWSLDRGRLAVALTAVGWVEKPDSDTKVFLHCPRFDGEGAIVEATYAYPSGTITRVARFHRKDGRWSVARDLHFSIGCSDI